MDPILALAREHGLYVVEDCAQAHGAFYKGRPVGSLGDIAAFSFCQDKILTTGGEGGLVVTANEGWWSRMWSYKDHGKAWDTVYRREHPPGFRWLHESFGTNWRLTEMQGALGLYQLAQLPAWIDQRRANTEALFGELRGLPGLRIPEAPADIRHACYKAYAFVRPEALKSGWDRDRILHAITDTGVPCLSGSCSEVYLEKAFDNSGLRPAERLPVARRLGETSLMFLVHPTLSVDDLKFVGQQARRVLEAATA